MMKYTNPNKSWYYNQRYDENSEKSIKGCFYNTVLFIVSIAILLLIFSCRSIQYIPVETVRTEYKHTADTVRQTDSVFNEKETIIKEADSALISSLGLQLRENEKAILILRKELERQVSKESEHRIDTVIKSDSIQVPYPVERQLSKWEQVKMNVGVMAIGACVLFIILIIIVWLLRFKK